MSMSKNCLFCKIIQGEIPSKKVYEDEYIYAFDDIDAQAPVHVLIIPKTHVRNMIDIDAQQHKDYVLAMQHAIKKIAELKGISEDGFRVVANTKKHGGQTVDHLHLHVLGGRQMKWPPG